MSVSTLSEEQKLDLVSSMVRRALARGLCARAASSLTAPLGLPSRQLSSIHLCSALEALALGSKTSLDPLTLYKVITGAAGNSWMFSAAGGELLLGQAPTVDELEATVGPRPAPSPAFAPC